MKRRSLSAILLGSLVSCCLPAAIAVTPTQVPQPSASIVDVPQGVSTNEATKKTPASLFDEPNQSQQVARLTLKVNVPHNQKPVLDVIAIHPYPVKPPVIKGPPPPLGEDKESLKFLLLHSGYATRANPDKPYPIGGWRWQYAYRDALRKSHMSTPHTIFGAYRWIDEFLPYALKETKRTNLLEKERYQRYEKAIEEFDKTRQDIETEAVQEGLSPVQIRPRKVGYVDSRIPSGNWWLTCTRKQPGITYYWLVPFSAAPGENVNLLLTQANAMVITGGW